MIEGSKSDWGFHFSYIKHYNVQSGGGNIVSPNTGTPRMGGGVAWFQPPEVEFKNTDLVDMVISKFLYNLHFSIFKNVKPNKYVIFFC